jgi:hypothetical protein
MDRSALNTNDKFTCSAHRAQARLEARVPSADAAPLGSFAHPREECVLAGSISDAAASGAAFFYVRNKPVDPSVNVATTGDLYFTPEGAASAAARCRGECDLRRARGREAGGVPPCTDLLERALGLVSRASFFEQRDGDGAARLRLMRASELARGPPREACHPAGARLRTWMAKCEAEKKKETDATCFLIVHE